VTFAQSPTRTQNRTFKDTRSNILRSQTNQKLKHDLDDEWTQKRSTPIEDDVHHKIHLSNDFEHQKRYDDNVDVDDESHDVDVNSTHYTQIQSRHSGDSSIPLDINHRIRHLWELLANSLRGLASKGYDRSMVYSVLPLVERQVLDPSLEYVQNRLKKRLSQTWRVDEPIEVVTLCQTFVKAYEEIGELLGGGQVYEGRERR
jgi:hypothetical protein